MRIVFLGPPGAGKGTQAANLTAYLGIPHLSTGEMLRQAKAKQSGVGKIAAEFLETGRLVPDPVIIQVVRARLRQPDCANGCLFDGFPRTLTQAETLDEYLRGNGTPLDVVLQLDVPEEALVKRLSTRGRDDDDIQTVRQRLKEFESLTRPLLKYYGDRNLLCTIDGTQTPEEVFDEIKHIVDKLAKA